MRRRVAGFLFLLLLFSRPKRCTAILEGVTLHAGLLDIVIHLPACCQMRDRGAMPDRLLDRIAQYEVSFHKEVGHNTRSSHSSCSSDAVCVVDNIERKIKVDDVFQTRNVQSS